MSEATISHLILSTVYELCGLEENAIFGINTSKYALTMETIRRFLKAGKQSFFPPRSQGYWEIHLYEEGISGSPVSGSSPSRCLQEL